MAKPQSRMVASFLLLHSILLLRWIDFENPESLLCHYLENTSIGFIQYQHCYFLLEFEWSITKSKMFTIWLGISRYWKWNSELITSYKKIEFFYDVCALLLAPATKFFAEKVYISFQGGFMTINRRRLREKVSDGWTLCFRFPIIWNNEKG